VERCRGVNVETKEEEEEVPLPAVLPLALRLPRDGVHDGVLRVHADGRVVLGVDDGGLAPGALHLDGLVGGEGGGGVEAVVGREEEEEGEGRFVREGGRVCMKERKHAAMLTANRQEGMLRTFGALFEIKLKLCFKIINILIYRI